MILVILPLHMIYDSLVQVLFQPVLPQCDVYNHRFILHLYEFSVGALQISDYDIL